MPAMERESSREPDPVARHQHSFSFSDSSGRASVPMWDSSDPERAPPPLPLNPTTGTPTTKANTSAGIAAAAKQIVEKARESAPISSYTSNGARESQGSPEKSLVKGAHHRRMQSLQPGHVKDLRSYLDNNRSPDRSPERPTSRGSFMPYSRVSSTEDFSPTPERSSTPTPAEREPAKETPTLRPSTRQPPRSILGENTPPSATMLALQTMQVPDPPLNDVTNGPSTPNGSRVYTNLDFSSQLLNLTTIATNLQKEMAQLSRRSKDNATDLISLKDATNQRDEDIRKSLRDLSTNVNLTQGLLPPPPPISGGTRSTSGFSAPQFLDSKAFSSPPSASKTYNLPRAASAHSFLDGDRCGSPSPYSVEGAASVAMLEKIIREMVTKDGQERLLSTLSELLDKSRKENVEAAKKVEQLSEFIREKSESQALVHVRNADGGAPRLDMNFGSPREFSKSVDKSKGADGPGHEELMKLLNRIKDSVAHSGGTSSEVKGLVRDLRGEVLGMGRELGKKLDQIGETSLSNTLDRSISDSKDSEHLEEVQRVVEEGIAELKQHLSGVLKERAEQDDDTFRQLATTRSGPNGDEMLSMVKHALAEHSSVTEKREPDVESIPNPGLDRDGVLDAVKEGLKDFEPNIELQQFGLERDEILAVLKEGLEDYQNSRTEPAPAGIDKGELFEVMQEALRDFKAPFPAEQLEQVKEELISNVREALSEFTPPPAASAMDSEAMHAAVFEAVKDGLVNHGPAGPREIEISRDDLFDAVKSSLDGSTIPFGGFGEQVLSQLRELVDGMRLEFKQYSAANGRDTEQVLDAVKDGLESLRTEIERYVDRAQDVTGKDEIVDTVKTGLEQLSQDVQGYVAHGTGQDAGRAEMLEYIKAEFEHLHDAVAHNGTSREVEESNAGQTTAVIIALKEGMDDVKAHLENRHDDTQSNEDINEAMKEEFEQLKGSLLNAYAADKSELIETIQDSMGALHSKLNGTGLSNMSGGSSEEVVHALREEMSTLKESIHAMVMDAEKDAVISGVQQALDELRTQLSADHDDASAEALGAIKEGLESFRESFNSSLVVGGGSSGEQLETLQEIRTTLLEVKESATKTVSGGMTDEQLEAFRGEFENLRTSIGNSVVHGGSNEEVLDAVRLGLDDLRSHLERKLDNPEHVMSHQSQVLDALNDGLDSLRTDIVKTLDKPLDMTVNYEILDTLKDGLAGLRGEMDKLTSGTGRPATSRGGEIVLADGAEVGTSRELGLDGEVPAGAESIKHASLEKVEVLLAQLQIKIEALDQTVQDIPGQHHAAAAPEGMAMKDDLAALEVMIKDVQDNVITLAAREEHAAPESAARKEDTDAIETLLRNTKSQLEEMATPDFSTMASKDHIDEVHAAVRTAHETIESLAERLDNTTACKADVAVVEVLAEDIKSLMEEVKEKVNAAPSESENKPELVTKADLDVLGVMCVEIKERVKEMILPDPDDMPSKAELEQLQGLINDFRESHDKMKDSYETDIAVTAKAFDDRKQEHEDTIAQLSEVKVLIDEVKAELLDKFSDGEIGVNTLGETLKGIEERTSNDNVIAEVKEIMDKVKEEFERAHESLGAIKVDHAQAAEASLEKQSEHKDAVLTALGDKLDTLFDGLTTKYDEAQQAAEEKAKMFEEKTAQQEEMLSTMKSLADELKLSIDTLGTTLTTFMGDLPAQVEKMTEDHKTVFSQVADTHIKLEEATEGLKGEHVATRDEVAKVLAAVDVVQGEMSEHHPRFMVTLEEVRALISSHYEHSQKHSEAAADHAQAVRDLQDALKAGFEDSKAQAEAQREGFKSDHEELKTALPALLPASVETAVPEKYDDAAVHEKLDKLMGHVEEASSRSTQLERLDQIHEKVMSTAAEVSAFVAAQNKQIANDHESKEKEAEEIALLLERRLERKDQLEADITVLNEEKESLANAVEALKAEKEALAAQKARLNIDVSSLETALHIRRDELHDMDNKAAAIERRMLEGVMNQSRMLLLTKTTKPPSPQKKKPQGRDLRVPSNASAVSAQTVTSSVPALKANHNLAMKSRGLHSGSLANTAERRIMSLNQINHNVPTGAHGFVATKPSLANRGLNNMKRSHSVKTHFNPRKPSWSVKRNVSLSSHNKENETLSEEDEEDLSRPGSSRGGDVETPSDVGTERRTSYLSGTDGSMTYATGSYLDGEDDHDREPGHYATSDMTYDTGSYLTGSYMTGSELDRRTSLGSSANGVVGVQSAINEEEPDAEIGAERGEDEHEEAVEHEVEAPKQLEAPPSPEAEKKGIARHFAPPSDSGLGTDLPTGMMSGSEGYFK
ncbi:hypothetical protein M409DRAFT_48894 [Zasmidium cellare ATCC 36951]|uniref:Uncharacterized protein n=1 Tax=Zasmidium cellare ATCC 36951 TaxID=1080233 RepID=A0A6A6D4K7_ZASCE|nr:uncharacterized protein M409DRAFT_48894 [Zasmidium cellare ATCC 36951]KAF2173995.1 hypothetical protein M409DRAFT_48894 [Zasmidium cellare ATCC 36951]